MTIIISRNKKHMALGRLMTQASNTRSHLMRVRQNLMASLMVLTNLDESYNVFKEYGKDIPKNVVASVEEEQGEVTRISKAILMTLGSVDKELKLQASKLDDFSKELEKAEKQYEKDLKKAQKPKKLSKEEAIQAATREIIAAKKDQLEKK